MQPSNIKTTATSKSALNHGFHPTCVHEDFLNFDARASKFLKECVHEQFNLAVESKIARLYHAFRRCSPIALHSARILLFTVVFTRHSSRTEKVCYKSTPRHPHLCSGSVQLTYPTAIQHDYSHFSDRS